MEQPSCRFLVSLLSMLQFTKWLATVLKSSITIRENKESRHRFLLFFFFYTSDENAVLRAKAAADVVMEGFPPKAPCGPLRVNHV